MYQTLQYSFRDYIFKRKSATGLSNKEMTERSVLVVSTAKKKRLDGNEIG